MLHDKRILLAALGVAALVAAVAAVPAVAKNPHGGSSGNSANAQQHVTICHATPPDTAANGYVQISPSASGVYNGHLQEHSADIIPPFVYNGVTYSENWDANGQAIWNNGCSVPSPTTSAAVKGSSHSQGTSHGKAKGKANGKANGKTNGETNGASGSQGNSANAQQHVTICHATPPDTAANGYVQISPSASGVYHGHLQEHAADIIPPFLYSGQTYSLNWDATGQAIWNNGCAVTSSPTAGAVQGASHTKGKANGKSKQAAKAAMLAQVKAAVAAILAELNTQSSVAAAPTNASGVAGASVTKGGVKAVTHRSSRSKPAAAAASFTG
jgi:hypothetical protein